MGIAISNLLIGTNPTDGASFTLPSVSVKKDDLLMLSVACRALDGVAPGLLCGFSSIGGIGHAVGDTIFNNFFDQDTDFRFGGSDIFQGWRCVDPLLPTCRVWGPLAAPAWNSAQFCARPLKDDVGQIVVTFGESASVLLYCLDVIRGLEFVSRDRGNVPSSSGWDRGPDGWGTIIENCRQAIDGATAQWGCPCILFSQPRAAFLYSAVTVSANVTMSSPAGFGFVDLAQAQGGAGADAGTIASHWAPGIPLLAAGCPDDGWIPSAQTDGINLVAVFGQPAGGGIRRRAAVLL